MQEYSYADMFSAYEVYSFNIELSDKFLTETKLEVKQCIESNFKNCAVLPGEETFEPPWENNECESKDQKVKTITRSTVKGWTRDIFLDTNLLVSQICSNGGVKENIYRPNGKKKFEKNYVTAPPTKPQIAALANMVKRQQSPFFHRAIGAYGYDEIQSLLIDLRLNFHKKNSELEFTRKEILRKKQTYGLDGNVNGIERYYSSGELQAKVYFKGTKKWYEDSYDKSGKVYSRIKF